MVAFAQADELSTTQPSPVAVQNTWLAEENHEDGIVITYFPVPVRLTLSVVPSNVLYEILAPLEVPVTLPIANTLSCLP